MSNHDAALWKPALPFLMLAYPVTFLLFQGGRYCEPICFTPTPAGIATVAVCLLVLAGVAWGIALGLRRVTPADGSVATGRLAAPPRLAEIVLYGMFGTFVLFLTVDGLSLHEPIWKPVVLPLSFLLFFPVWALYGATFPLAVVFSVAGVNPSPSVTLLTRGIVLGVGFPASALLQTYVASALVSNRQTASD